MLKRIVILSFLVSFTLISLSSCKKEIIKPCNENDMPQLLNTGAVFNSQNFSKIAVSDSSNDGYNKNNESGNLSNSGVNTSSSDTDSNITDPNQDPDASKRKGKK